ncbi:MAG: fructosamine kinase family protein [Candidatus Nitronauta litoralis]|uniref:Fructosamine kinase family protein n=1 Tax=Candidatus Nitronauta litoralis TaxID=2705533 RepID=A0A7T0BZG2_9BACT|nr:MAG: fructosamine kinase family protein [Candidatus Nitronauta litoralis]
MKEAIRARLSKSFRRDVSIASTCDVGGGCINQAQVLILDEGTRVFVKRNACPPAGMFETESKGLQLMAAAKNGPRVPKVIACDDQKPARFLILDYLESTSPGKDYFTRFGHALAAMHRITADSYGLDHDNFIGSTPQINTREKNGLKFFRDQRLGFQQELARNSGLLPKKTDQKLDELRAKIGDLLNIEDEQPALIHGDLWSGNHFCGPCGEATIFDPAAHFGLREADLAMTELFGRMPQAFYDAYHEAFPLNPGYQERRDIYNLYHLLNHLNLFGGSYLGSVETIICQFIR